MNVQWRFFKTKILSLTQTFISSRIISAKRRDDKLWLSRELRSKINRKNRFYRSIAACLILRGFKNDGYWQNCDKRYAQDTRNVPLISSEKLKNNPKGVWKYMKNKSNSMSPIPEVMDAINYVSNTEAKAEGFNTNFQSVFSQPVNRHSVCQNVGALPQMNEIEISERGVMLLL